MRTPVFVAVGAVALGSTATWAALASRALSDGPVSVDLALSLAMLALLAAGAVLFALRVRLAGPVHFARVDAAGGSPLLGKRALELGYYWLQPVAGACARAGLSANCITLASLALAALAGAALALGHFGVAAALCAVSWLGDALDGLVARATGRASEGGALLDASSDRYGEFFFLGGLALHLRGDAAALALTLFALLGSYMVSYGSAKAEGFGVKPPRGAMRRVERATWLCAGALLTPVAGVVAARLGLPPAAGEAPMLATLALVALVANVSAVRRLRAVAAAVRAARAAAPKAAVLTLAKAAEATLAPKPTAAASGR